MGRRGWFRISRKSTHYTIEYIKRLWCWLLRILYVISNNYPNACRRHWLINSQKSTRSWMCSIELPCADFWEIFSIDYLNKPLEVFKEVRAHTCTHTHTHTHTRTHTHTNTNTQVDILTQRHTHTHTHLLKIINDVLVQVSPRACMSHVTHMNEAHTRTHTYTHAHEHTPP